LGLRQCGKTTLARPVALGAGARIFDLENPDYVAALENPIKPSIPRLLFPLSTFRFFFRPPSGIENDSTTQPINTVQMQCHRKNLTPRLKACFEAEHRSFWFRHRNDCIRELVRNFQPKGKVPIFDVGGGNGFLTWNV
jgi:hypothetical protein